MVTFTRIVGAGRPVLNRRQFEAWVILILVASASASSHVPGTGAGIPSNLERFVSSAVASEVVQGRVAGGPVEHPGQGGV